MSRAAFWWRYQRWPLALFALAAGVLATTELDVAIARQIFFDAAQGEWLGAGSWWTNEFVHVGGRWMIRCVGAAAIALWLASYLIARMQPLRRPSAFVIVAMALTVGCIGLTKATSNIDCPWDLQPFGGPFPYVHLFANRPAELPVARCFPAAHAGSGYALLAIYFVAYERSRRIAYAALFAALCTGLVFGVAQQARGAHFMSHDIWSVFIAWTISLTVYSFPFERRLWSKSGS